MDVAANFWQIMLVAVPSWMIGVVFGMIMMALYVQAADNDIEHGRK